MVIPQIGLIFSQTSLMWLLFYKVLSDSPWLKWWVSLHPVHTSITSFRSDLKTEAFYPSYLISEVAQSLNCLFIQQLLIKQNFFIKHTFTGGVANWVKGVKKYKLLVIKQVKSWRYNVQRGDYS